MPGVAAVFRMPAPHGRSVARHKRAGPRMAATAAGWDLERARQAPPASGTLLAERSGVALAAVALTSGSVAADPSYPTAIAVRALRYRRYQLLRQGGDVGPAWSLLRRRAPAR